MSGITTHVLDTSSGRPAAGVAVHLERLHEGVWETVGQADTDADGRARALVPAGQSITAGTYRLTFHTNAYFARNRTRTFYPHVTVTFEVLSGEPHYHVPLLVSPFGYTTYRGS
jgi:5-hydroxyisourate hydrolase